MRGYHTMERTERLTWPAIAISCATFALAVALAVLTDPPLAVPGRAVRRALLLRREHRPRAALGGEPLGRFHDRHRDDRRVRDAPHAARRAARRPVRRALPPAAAASRLAQGPLQHRRVRHRDDARLRRSCRRSPTAGSTRRRCCSSRRSRPRSRTSPRTSSRSASRSARLRGEPTRRVLWQLAGWQFHIYPFAFLGVVIGRLYLDVGVAVVPLVVVPILVARHAYASYLHLREANEAALATLVRALETKDRYTAGHAERVAVYASYIGEELGLRPRALDRLRHAALMHDIGKLVVPNQLLNKPGRLTAPEYEVVRRHEELSIRLLERIDFLAPVAPMAIGVYAPLGVDGRRDPHRALHHRCGRRVRRHDVDARVPARAHPGDRVRGVARALGLPVPPALRRSPDRGDRTPQRVPRRRLRARRPRWRNGRRSRPTADRARPASATSRSRAPAASAEWPRAQLR